MKKYLTNAAAVLAFSLLFASLPYGLFKTSAFQRLSLETRDIFFKLRQVSSETPAKADDIVLVTIDDASCQKLDMRWPWPRSVFSKLVDNLKNSGARVIALDLSFTGIEGGDDSTTRQLARSLSDHGNSVIGVTFDDENRLVKPTPLIAEAAGRYGYLEKIVDPDLHIRRSYLVRPYAHVRGFSGSDAFAGSFPLEVMSAYSGSAVKGSPEYDQDLGLVTMGESPRRAVYVESDGSYVINYLADDTDFARISAWKVIEGRSDPVSLKNKVVLVGQSSALLSDMHPTPLGLEPGIVINANELLAMIEGRQLSFVPDWLTTSFSWFVAVCVLVLFLARKFWLGITASVIALAGLWIGAELLFLKDTLMEPLPLLCGPGLALL